MARRRIDTFCWMARAAAIFAAILVQVAVTYGQGENDDSAFQKADARLNQTYASLRSMVNETGQSTLKLVQRSWVSFKEADFTFFRTLALAAHDLERAERYRIEETWGQAYALEALGSPGNQREDGVRTAAEADRLLNQVYRECLDLLPDTALSEMKQIQAKWIEFRDHYCRLDAEFRSGRPDDSALCTLTMMRVVQLRHHIRVLLGAELPRVETVSGERLGGVEEDGIAGKPPADPFRFAALFPPDHNVDSPKAMPEAEPVIRAVPVEESGVAGVPESTMDYTRGRIAAFLVDHYRSEAQALRGVASENTAQPASSDGDSGSKDSEWRDLLGGNYSDMVCYFPDNDADKKARRSRAAVVADKIKSARKEAGKVYTPVTSGNDLEIEKLPQGKFRVRFTLNVSDPPDRQSGAVGSPRLVRIEMELAAVTDGFRIELERAIRTE